MNRRRRQRSYLKERYLEPEPDRQQKLVHVVIKATGKGHKGDDFIFNSYKRKELLGRFMQYLTLYPAIRLLGATMMSNHGHLIVQIDHTVEPVRSELAEAYRKVYHCELHTNSHAIRVLERDRHDLSKLIQRFCHDTAWYFNRKVNFKRTGHLWSRRFHSTVLDSPRALLNCWTYVIMNPVKANIVDTPLDWDANTLRGPKSDQVMKNMFEVLKRLGIKPVLSLKKVRSLLTKLIQTALRKWHHMDSKQKEEFKENLRFWDRAEVVSTRQRLCEIGRNRNHRTTETAIKALCWMS